MAYLFLALLKALVALLPVSMLLAGSAMLLFREKALSSVAQLFGAVCLLIVVLIHVCEALGLFPSMHWGRERSVASRARATHMRARDQTKFPPSPWRGLAKFESVLTQNAFAGLSQVWIALDKGPKDPWGDVYLEVKRRAPAAQKLPIE